MIFLYIWMWAVLVEVHQWIVPRQVGGAVTLGFAFFNALVLAKVIPVTEDLRLGHWPRLEPLSIRPCAKLSSSRSYTSCSSLLRASSPGFSKANLGSPGNRRRIAGLLADSLVYFVARMPFFGFRHVSRVLGQGRSFISCRELSPKLHSH